MESKWEEIFCGRCEFEIEKAEERHKRRDGNYFCSGCKEKILEHIN